MTLTFNQLKQALVTDFPLYEEQKWISKEEQDQLIKDNDLKWNNELKIIEGKMKEINGVSMDDKTSEIIQQELNTMDSLLDNDRTLLKLPSTRDIIKTNVQSLIKILNNVQGWREYYWGEFVNGEWTKKKYSKLVPQKE